ncbi:MAG: hypothetical protein ACKO01_03825 [Erythrobacter sp.]
MKTRLFLAAAGFSLGLSHPAIAADPTDPAGFEPHDKGVVVSTDRPEPRKLGKEERRAQRKIVRDLSREVIGRQNQNRKVSRFYSPLCLAVAGVKKRHVADFSDRILDNAEKAGIALAGDNCKPNAMVIFTGHSRNELRELRRKNPTVFNDLGPDSFRKLVRSRDEAFAYRGTVLTNIHGVPFGIETLMGPTDQGSTYVGLGMQMPPRFGVSGAVVLIDRDATEGMTALQLADYATLRLLAPTDEIKDEIPGAPPTIMSLFRDTQKAPRQLTEFDLAYLNSVYTIRPPHLVPNAIHSSVMDQIVRP